MTKRIEKLTTWSEVVTALATCTPILNSLGEERKRHDHGTLLTNRRVGKIRKFLNILVILLLNVFHTASSFGDDKPDGKELQNIFELRLPAHIQINNFEIEVLENLGNKIEPLWGSRFKAVISTNAPLYEIDHKEDDVTFLVLRNEKGTKSEVYGKTYSTLYQGKWQHKLDIDGDPIKDLGEAVDVFKDTKVIVRGSQEEKNYFSQFKETHDLYYAAIKSREVLVGKAWSNQRTYPVEIRLLGFKDTNEKFVGEFHWSTLDSIRLFEGKLSHDKLFIEEMFFVNKGNSSRLCHYTLPLLSKDNSIRGKYSRCGRGEIELSIGKGGSGAVGG